MFQAHLDVNVSAEKLWRVAGEQFGQVGQYASGLSSSHLEGPLEVGGTRVCMIGKTKMVETLLSYDAEERTLSYRLVHGGPQAMMKKAENHWAITSLGPHRSRLTLTPTVEFKWWAFPMGLLFKLEIRSVFQTFFDELKHYAETGMVHPRKLQRDAKEGRVNPLMEAPALAE